MKTNYDDEFDPKYNKEFPNEVPPMNNNKDKNN